MATTLTPAAVGYIDTIPNLELVDLSLLPPGMYDVVRVGYTGLWHLRTDSVATVDHVTVATAFNAPTGGRWCRDPSGVPGAHLIPAWYVDTSLGSDSAAGTSALTPLATSAEILRRIGGQSLSGAPTVVINGAGSVPVLSIATAVLTGPLASALAANATGQGAALVTNHGTGNTVQADLTTLFANDAASVALQKVTATIAYGALAAGNSNGAAVSVNCGATLPANARILGVNLKLATPFTGGSATTVVLDIGTSGDPVAIVAGADVLHAAVDGYAFTMPAGKAPNKHFVSIGAQLLARFTPDGSHQLVNLTAGSITIDVLYSVLA